MLASRDSQLPPTFPKEGSAAAVGVVTLLLAMVTMLGKCTAAGHLVHGDTSNRGKNV